MPKGKMRPMEIARYQQALLVTCAFTDGSISVGGATGLPYSESKIPCLPNSNSLFRWIANCAESAAAQGFLVSLSREKAQKSRNSLLITLLAGNLQWRRVRI
jgi:hypothetical protein